MASENGLGSTDVFSFTETFIIEITIEHRASAPLQIKSF
jgi:hypothetical protein